MAMMNKNMTGKTKKRIKENHQPIKNAKNRPAIDIAKDSMIVPIFSPSAL
jgi:hypothetical protein